MIKMGVLTDLVIGNEEDATTIANLHYPLGEFTGIDIKGVDTVKLTTLHSILSAEAFKDLLAQYNPIASASEDGPWVFVLPADLVARLAGLDDTEITDTAARWGNTEEFQLDGWSQTNVTDVLRGMAHLARQASAQEKRIFVWMSL
jgi:hypothetical protein